MNLSLKQIGTHFLVILGFALVAVLYFNPVLKGKKSIKVILSNTQEWPNSTSTFETLMTPNPIGPTVPLGACQPINSVLNTLTIILRNWT